MTKKTKSTSPQPTSVVTGAAGFLGSHLTDLLLARGHKVVGIDNFVTGSVDNIAHLGGNRNFKFIQQDVTEFIFLDIPVDYVWHFASPASPIDYLELPIQTLKVGSLGTHKALGLTKNKKARFLLASTSEIYGDPLVHPQTEDYWGNVNPIGPRGCYDEAKRFAEALTVAYHKEHSVETRIVRIFNTYGPRMRLNDGRVIPAFISQALKNKPLTVFGKGKQTRSFCYVSDLVEGIYRLMMSAFDGPVNIGNPNEMTMLQFAKEIIRATGSRSSVMFKPLPQDDPRQRKPDITRARKLLGWEPAVSLDAGLKRTIDYFRAKSLAAFAETNARANHALLTSEKKERFGMKTAITMILAAVCLSASAPLNQEMRTFKGKLYDVNQSPMCLNVPPLDSKNGNHYYSKITSINPKTGKMAILITLNADAKDKEFDEWHNQTVLLLNHPKWKQFSVGWKIQTDRYFDLGMLRVTNSAGVVKEMRTFDYGTPVRPDKN